MKPNPQGSAAQAGSAQSCTSTTRTSDERAISCSPGHYESVRNRETIYDSSRLVIEDHPLHNITKVPTAPHQRVVDLPTDQSNSFDYWHGDDMECGTSSNHVDLGNGPQLLLSPEAGMVQDPEAGTSPISLAVLATSATTTPSVVAEHCKDTEAAEAPSMNSYMQTFDRMMQPTSRRPRMPKTTKDLVNLPRIRGSAGACQKHKNGKGKCLCPSRPSSDQSPYSEQPSPSTTNDSDDVIGHRVGLKNLAKENSLHLNHGLQPDDGEIAFSNVHTPLQSISVDQNTSDELLVFTCPFIKRLCFFQTSDITEFNSHCQEHATH